MQAAALAAERRAQAQAACGCDEVRGTQLGYDEEHGQVIVLDDDDNDHGVRYASPSDSNLDAAGRSRQADASTTEGREDGRSRKECQRDFRRGVGKAGQRCGRALRRDRPHAVG